MQAHNAFLEPTSNGRGDQSHTFKVNAFVISFHEKTGGVACAFHLSHSPCWFSPASKRGGSRRAFFLPTPAQLEAAVRGRVIIVLSCLMDASRLRFNAQPNGQIVSLRGQQALMPQSCSPGLLVSIHLFLNLQPFLSFMCGKATDISLSPSEEAIPLPFIDSIHITISSGDPIVHHFNPRPWPPRALSMKGNRHSGR